MAPTRKQIKQEHKKLAKQMSEIFFRHDPIGIAFEEYQNYDEYDPEVSTILPRLATALNEADVVKIVHEEFVTWFQESAGEKEKYVGVAKEIWALWQVSQK